MRKDNEGLIEGEAQQWYSWRQRRKVAFLPDLCHPLLPTSNCSETQTFENSLYVSTQITFPYFKSVRERKENPDLVLYIIH